MAYEHYHRYLWAQTLMTGKRVLDVGSGEGYGSALLADVAASVHGIDIDVETVEHSRLCYGGPNLRFDVASATDLSHVPDNSFDAVVAFEVVEHVDEQEAMLAEIVRVLADDGFLVISTPDRRAYAVASSEPNPHHVRELTEPEFRDLLAPWFGEVRVFGQRTASGSRIEALDQTQPLPGPAFNLELQGGEWRVAGAMSPLYLIAVACRDAVPELAQDSTLSDFGLELLRRAERAAAQERTHTSERHAAELETLGAEHTTELTRVTQEHDAERERLAAEHNGELIAISGDHAAQLAGLVRDHAAQTSRLEEHYQSELDRAQARHGAEVARLGEHTRALDGARNDAERRAADIDALRAEAAARSAEAEELRGFVAAATDARRRLARVDGSVVWQVFQRTRVRVYRRLGGEDSRGGRALSRSLRWYGHSRGLIDPVVHTPAPEAGVPMPRPITTSAPPVEPLLSYPLCSEPVASIVIPVRCGAAMTYRCLEAIHRSTNDVTYEVILVDDDADAETRHLLTRIEGATILTNDTNMGYMRSVNRGARGAHGRHIVLLNNDTQPHPGWLKALVHRLESAPDIGITVPKLLYPDGRLQESGSIVWRDGGAWNYGNGADQTAYPFNFVRDVDYGSAAALAIRGDLWREIGGFDERYIPAYYEDCDLCFAARARGWRVVYEPRSTVVHVRGGSHGTDENAVVRRFLEANRSKFVEKWADVLVDQPSGDPQGHDDPSLAAAADRNHGSRVLIFDHSVPTHDRDAGSLRMHHIVRNLLELGHRVTFVPDNYVPFEPYTSELQGLGVEVLYGAVDIVARLRGMVGETRLVILSRPYVAARYLHLVREYVPGARVLYDTVDLHYLRESRRAELEGATNSLKVVGFRELEHGLMRAVDATIAVSASEADVVRADVAGADVHVIGLANDVWSHVPAREGRRDLMFLGNFHHAPNIDAAVHLARDIMPLVWRTRPDVTLKVVGGNATPEVLALERPNIELVGWVEDLEPLLAMTVALVAPLRYGAGVKGKVTQALGAGLPVVTSPDGCEGLPCHPGQDILVARDADQFAARILELLSDDELWHRLSRNGQELAQRICSSRTQRDELEAMLTRLDVTANGAVPANPREAADQLTA